MRVTRIFADAAADPKIAAFELAVSLGQRARLVADADVENELPAAEAACLDVMNLIGQVCNGGYEHWVDNGYYLRGEETCAALETLGLVRFARLTEKALNAIPDETYAWGVMRLSARRQAYFDRLDSRFFRVLDELSAVSNTPDQRLVVHARRHGIVPLGAAEPRHLKTDGGAPLSSAVACLRLHDVRWQSAALV